MLSLDSTTLAQYAAASTYDARAQVIVAALPDVVEIKVYNAGALVGSGTMTSPWATVAGPVITIGEISSFTVLTTGPPIPSTWYLRFESGTKWLRGTFGLSGSGADFTWSRPVWKAGQKGKLGTGTIQTPRFDVRLASFATTEGTDTAALAAAVASEISWDALTPVALSDVTEGVEATRDLSVYATIPNGTTPAFTLVSQSKDGTPGSYGITVDETTGVLTVPDTVTADDYSVVVDLARAAAEITTLGISAAGAWTFGQAFAQGDAPDYVAIEGGQAEIRNRWADGSVKFAVLSKVSSGAETVSITTSPAATSGTALTQAAMVAALTGTNTIVIGTDTVTLSDMLAGTPQRTVHEGPVMSNWIFRQALTVGTDLSLWVDVRYYSNGAIELFPWVENAVLRTGSPVNYSGACSVTINGTSRFSATVDFKARTRIPLLSGTLSHWHGTDPGITPAHNSAYLKSTKLVANYGPTLGSAVTSGMTTSYTPNTLAGLSSAMGAAGGAGSVEGAPSIWYVQAPGATSYAASLVRGLSSGSWSIHHRDGTSHEPFTFTDEPNTSFNVSPPASATGGTNGDYASTHEPGFAFIPYLISGRWWFMDELQFGTNWHFLDYQSAERFGADAICNPVQSGSQRMAAWALRSYAQTLAAIPDSHPRRDELIAAWEANCQYWRTRFVDGGTYKTSSFGTSWISPQGFIAGSEDYGNSATSWYSGGFMFSYLPVVWGVAWDYGLPLGSTGLSNHQAVRDHCYKQIVGRAGTLAGSGFNWRHLSIYSYAMSNKDRTTYYTHAQSHADMATVFSWTAESENDAEGGYLFQSSAETSLTGVSGLPYAASALGGLALAVDHGYTGASAGWSRVTGASNYAASLGTYNANENPTFAMVPR